MPIRKSIDYSVWCDLCDDFLDFASYKNQRVAIVAWKKDGWKKVDGLWVCPKCAQQSMHPTSETLPDLQALSTPEQFPVSKFFLPRSLAGNTNR